jgi:hypothetical protein
VARAVALAGHPRFDREHGLTELQAKLIPMPFDEPKPPNEPTRAETSNQAFEELRSRLGQPIAFYRSLVPIAGGAKAAILLGQMLYWTRHGRGLQSNGGWFYKTAPQWRRETGLSHR